MLFQDALREVCAHSELIRAMDGQDLMEVLRVKVPPSPEVIFLDLNMPRKNGFECLMEIRRMEKFRHIPIIIFSTSSQPDIVNKVYQNGASFYLPKPNSYSKLKRSIATVLSINWDDFKGQPSRDRFILGQA